MGKGKAQVFVEVDSLAQNEPVLLGSVIVTLPRLLYRQRAKTPS